MVQLGLKSNIRNTCIDERLRHRPSILEFHLDEQDLGNTEVLVNRIRYVQSKGVKVYLHHPPKHNDQFLDIISQDDDMVNFYNWSTDLLLRISREEKVKIIIHAHYTDTESSDASDKRKIELVKNRISSFQNKGGDSLLWENSIEGIFSFQNETFLNDIVKPLNLKLCFDISHTFISLRGNNHKLKEALECTKPYVHYFHVVDSMGIVHDGLPLGEGNIDWRMVKPYLTDKDYIFEIDLRTSNYEDCTPMVKSAEYLADIIKAL